MFKKNSGKSKTSIKAKIDLAKAALEPSIPKGGAASQAHLAWRMVIDLVAGVGLGAAIGYGLDILFDTLPVLMAIFTLLGLAAGVNLMLRTAREVNKENEIDRGDFGGTESGN